MADLLGSTTHANLVEALLHVSHANSRHLWFAQAADVEGRPAAAAAFRAIAENQTAHAFGHLDFLCDVGDPETGLPIGDAADNLAAALAAINGERARRHRTFAEVARAEGFAAVADWFDAVADDERAHLDRLAAVAEAPS